MREEDKEVFEDLTACQAMALTLYLEARGEGREGMVAVAYVILNRANNPGWWGKDVKSVCFHPFQFSCYNSKDNPEYELGLEIAKDFDNKCTHDHSLMECFELAKSIKAGDVTSPFSRDDVCYYHTTSTRASWDNAFTLVATIGNQEFYHA